MYKDERGAIDYVEIETVTYIDEEGTKWIYPEEEEEENE